MASADAPTHNAVASAGTASVDCKIVGRKRHGGQPRSCRWFGHGRSATAGPQCWTYLYRDNDSKHPHVPHDGPILGSICSFLLGSRGITGSATCVDVWKRYLEQHKRQIVQDSSWRSRTTKFVESKGSGRCSRGESCKRCSESGVEVSTTAERWLRGIILSGWGNI